MTAKIVEDSDAVTAFEAMLNVAVDAPFGTVMDAGTVTSATVEEIVTTCPLLPALFERVTLPVLVLPPTTRFGVRVRPLIDWAQHRKGTIEARHVMTTRENSELTMTVEVEKEFWLGKGSTPHGTESSEAFT